MAIVRILRRLVVLLTAFSVSCASAPKGVQEGALRSIEEQIKNLPAELHLASTPLADDENAFPLWLKAVRVFKLAVDEDLQNNLDRLEIEVDIPPDETGAKAMRDWFEQNRVAMKLLREGIRKGNCRFPPSAGPKSEFSYLIPLRHMGLALAAQARLETMSGNVNDAADKFLDVGRMGDLFLAGEGPLIHVLVGYSQQRSSAEGIRWLVARPDISEITLRRLAAEPASYSMAAPGLAHAYRLEFAKYFLPLILDPASCFDEKNKAMNKLVGNPACFDKTDTFQVGVEFYRRMVANCGRSWPKRDRGIGADAKKIAEGLPNGIMKLTSPMKLEISDEEVADVLPKLEGLRNPVGRALVSNVITALDYAHPQQYEILAERRASQILAALRVYVLRSGALPESLDVLVKERILSAVPNDPFSEMPFRYSKDQRRIWSIGADEEDDLGEGDEGTFIADKELDYVWTVSIVGSSFKEIVK